MIRFSFLILFISLQLPLFGQNTAQKRAAKLGLGMNLSYLDNYWNGSKARHFSDFAKPADVAIRKQRLADLAKAGFKTVRIPVCFGAWASVQPPYKWDTPDQLYAPDSLVKWALANNLNVLIDLHHVEFDRSIAGADTTARVNWLWQQIAERYKTTDPEKVLFELRNEPNGMTAATWRKQADVLIQTVRAIAPNHTLVVGFHDWNGRDAMLQSEPFADPNIIYTFHFYDPFIFTHQGATWAGQGIPDLKGIPFPATKGVTINVPASAKGTWVESAINNYANEATYDAIYKSLSAAKAWSVAKNVPIFLGEFGSYNLNATPTSRCQHAEAIYYALSKLQIPSAWWEWDGGFSMFGSNSTQIMPCMLEALRTYATGEIQVLSTDPATGQSFRVFPNPSRDQIRVEAGNQPAHSVRLVDSAGRTVLQTTDGSEAITLHTLGAGIYLLTAFDQSGKELGTARLLKQ
ncbi:cellulase family glycosylhydrolase [Fibrella aquatilis]|uniref:Cellulase family glycosylhydrolase n=1 Tax=Fibrella aquatilis TaxID=2817059 RepID=A0A939K0G3_9BACT|nr:cellulase family glycosylhydrolase [Fibrella aquatilis]MBO0934164.1 cellulase family glycosylhydrolase [Fibrella aquatilis]